MRKRGAAFADNAQAAPALPDKHTRKQKECGGGAPPAQPGVPSPTTAVQGAGWESPATHPGDSAPSASLGTAQECGCLLIIVAPTKRCWGAAFPRNLPAARPLSPHPHPWLA